MKGSDLFLLTCCLCSLSTLGGASDVEKTLFKSMFTNYNTKVRPARTPEERVVVRVGMVLSSFVGLNMKNEEMSTIVVMNLEWTDHRLSWKPKDYDGIEVLRIPSGKVWLPDIVLINNYMVMPFVAQDLGHIMKRRRLTDRIIVYLFYQLLRGLKYIHSAGIIHRDLKPGNLAVNENCELKILDFGLARQTETEMTGYVVTRWYRAPEVIFNWMHYSQTVDVWSAACILAEMITGRVLFSGHDSIDQLKKILRLTGTPDGTLVQKMQSKDAQSYVQGLPPQKKKNFREVFPDMEQNAVDLLEGMLLLDPETRLTAKQGLSHPFLAEYHDPESEPDSQPYDDSFENLELAVGEWKSLIHMEIMTFDPDNPSVTAM